MAQVSMTVRMDSGLKNSFDALCAQFGMSANTAMNVFAKAVVQRGRIPFEIRGDQPVSSDEDADLKTLRAICALAKAGALPYLPDEDPCGQGPGGKKTK